MPAGIKANPDGSAAIQVGGTDVITLTSGGAATFVTSPTTVQAGTAAAPSITFSGDTNTGIYSPGADTIAFTEGGVESMRLNSSAQLSLNTTVANERLNLYSNNFTYIGMYNSTTGTASSDGGYIGMSNAELEIRNKENNIISFFTNNTERTRIDSSGNVLVGATSALTGGDSLLYVAGSIYSAVGAAGLAGNGAQGYTLYNQYYNGTNNAARIAGFGGRWTFDIAAGFLSYTTYTSTTAGGVPTGTERMRITDGGDLLINTTTRSNLEKVNITHNGASQEGVIIVNTNTSAGTHTAIGFRRPSATTVGNITTTLSSTAYVTSSDYRLKENVQPMTGALAKVAALKPCTYTWKVDGSTGEGFIAHELAEVVPDAVTGEKDAVNEDGSIKPQGIDTSFLVATLTAAIQEQQAMIDELKAKVAALEGA